MAKGEGKKGGDKEFKPYIASDVEIPELTVKAIGLGILLSITMSAANAYLGLYVGMTVSAAIPAAVIFMAILRSLHKAGVFKVATILESNLGKTIAAAGEALAAGVIFTFPALLLMLDENGDPIWEQLDYMVVMVIAALGGTLGVLFSITLRRILIIDQALPYPEGIAAAEVLKAGEGSGKAVMYVFTAFFIGMLFRMATALETRFGTVSLGLWGSRLGGTYQVGEKTLIHFGTEYSVALLGVGYIIGPRIAFMVFSGGFIGWFVALPIISTITPDDFPFDAITRVRFFGVGTMLVGGLWTLWTIRSAIITGVRDALGGIFGKKVPMDSVPRVERDIPPNISMTTAFILTIPIMGVIYYLSGSLMIAVVAGVIMTGSAFLFSAIAGYIAGIVGSSNNPLSGVTIIVIMFSSILLYALGARGVEGMIAVISVGAVVACASAIAGDNLQDLKSGYLLGSTPWRLQVALIIGVFAAALVLAPVVNILHEAYVIGVGLQAPQAFLMAAIVEGVFTGNMDWTMVAAGAVLGIAFIIMMRVTNVQFSIMAVAVGMYLPWLMSTPIMIGGVVKWYVDRRINERLKPLSPEADEETTKEYEEDVETFREEVHNKGILFSSGLIAGEALMGVIMAGLVVAGISIAVIEGAPGLAGLPVFLYMAFLVGYVAWRDLDKKEVRKKWRRLLK
ncbi:MAG: oligopeptide transporter, OPT family [Thermoplasmata archaeon]|nr:MAG: oligopeptide transporter, OPT family [Thermoplasmata archaeon]